MRPHPVYKHFFLVMIIEQSTSVTIIIIGYSLCLLMADRVQKSSIS